MQFVSLPEQFTPNRPSEHWHCPSIPQVPWPLHVVLGLQNSKTKEKKVTEQAWSHGGLQTRGLGQKRKESN